MGSDLYASVDVRHPNTKGIDPNTWSEFIKGTKWLGRHFIPEAFGSLDADLPHAAYRWVNGREEKKPLAELHALGYLTTDEIRSAQKLEEDCPWWHDEPYWVRKVDGREFVAIVREKRWQGGGDCCPELRALAAAVESLLSEGLDVRVWCWHSQ